MVLSLEHSRHGQSCWACTWQSGPWRWRGDRRPPDGENRSRDKSVIRQEWRKGRGWWRAWQQASCLWSRGSLSSGTQERGCARRPWEQGDRPALRWLPKVNISDESSQAGERVMKGGCDLCNAYCGHIASRCHHCCLVDQLYPTRDPMKCGPPGSSVHGILQARILEWAAISFSRGSSWPRDWTYVSCISCIGRRILCHWC